MHIKEQLRKKELEEERQIRLATEEYNKLVLEKKQKASATPGPKRTSQ